MAAFNAALSYTTGNWTVTSLTTDTITVGKTITLPDLDYVHDFVKTEDGAEEARMANTTGTSLASAENLRFAKSDVKNVYTNTSIPAASQMSVKAGVRTLVEVSCTIHAVNSVSGEEYELPLRAWVCVQIPTASIVSDEAMRYVLGRALGALFATGDITIDREEAIARGSLLPV